MAKFTLVLASKSPRRQALIAELGIPFEVRIKEVEEIYPAYLDPRKVPEYLARLKAEALRASLSETEVLLTSDTVVILDNQVLGKPADAEEAKKMLRGLSGKTHEVITGVSLISQQEEVLFSNCTRVTFSELEEREIDSYVSQFKPFDKAGSYGIQEWIGYIGVQKIEGCYYNVMGLPLHEVYSTLKERFGLEL